MIHVRMYILFTFMHLVVCCSVCRFICMSDLAMFFSVFLACTQTTLTFPSNFDLEKLLASLSDRETAPAPDDDSDSSERGGAMDDETSLGNSLRRKLFGQPDRQVCTVCMHVRAQAMCSCACV